MTLDASLYTVTSVSEKSGYLSRCHGSAGMPTCFFFFNSDVNMPWMNNLQLDNNYERQPSFKL